MRELLGRQRLADAGSPVAYNAATKRRSRRPYPQTSEAFQRSLHEAFAQGPGGYADDRLADGAGWTTFDIGAIAFPVTVLHGTRDTLTPLAHAHHTASLVPGATLRVLDDLGHFSVIPEVVGAVQELLDRP